MMGLAIQYLLQMALRVLVAKSDDLGAIFNILCYTPCFTLIAMGIYNIEATHANRRKIEPRTWRVDIYAAIIAVFLHRLSVNSGSLNIWQLALCDACFVRHANVSVLHLYDYD